VVEVQGWHAILFVRTLRDNIRNSWNLVCYGLRNDQNCRTFVRRLFYLWIFTIIIFIRQNIIFIRTKIISVRPKIFWAHKDFLLVLTFFCSYFFGGKIAQNLREFIILFGNIYEWSGALVKFHENFFSTNSVFIVSYS